MHPQCVIAQFESVERARLGLQVLAKAGFGEDQVSFVSRSDASELGEIGKLREDAADNTDSSASAGIGGLLGGGLAAPVAASTLIGPFMLIGPLVAAGVGAAIGGILGGAQIWGVDRNTSESYEASVERGAVLVIVNGSECWQGGCSVLPGPPLPGWLFGICNAATA
jgi:hypothetical protein